MLFDAHQLAFLRWIVLVQALYDPLRQRRSCVEEEKCSRGGLNIAVAMKRMAEEAGTDKRIHRDRVKRQRLVSNVP